MTESDLRPLPGEFTDRGVNLWAFFCRRRALPGNGGYGQHRAVKGEQNERPEPAAPAILSLLVCCHKDLVAIFLPLPCRLPVFLR